MRRRVCSKCLLKRMRGKRKESLSNVYDELCSKRWQDTERKEFIGAKGKGRKVIGCLCDVIIKTSEERWMKDKDHGCD